MRSGYFTDMWRKTENEKHKAAERDKHNARSKKNGSTNENMSELKVGLVHMFVCMQIRGKGESDWVSASGKMEVESGKIQIHTV